MIFGKKPNLQMIGVQRYYWTEGEKARTNEVEFWADQNYDNRFVKHHCLSCGRYTRGIPYKSKNDCRWCGGGHEFPHNLASQWKAGNILICGSGNYYETTTNEYIVVGNIESNKTKLTGKRYDFDLVLSNLDGPEHLLCKGIIDDIQNHRMPYDFPAAIRAMRKINKHTNKYKEITI